MKAMRISRLNISGPYAARDTGKYDVRRCVCCHNMYLECKKTESACVITREFFNGEGLPQNATRTTRWG
jgi:hypothetical protein